jgi:hypothetical protein
MGHEAIGSDGEIPAGSLQTGAIARYQGDTAALLEENTGASQSDSTAAAGHDDSAP